jgi:hypothetical protein
MSLSRRLERSRHISDRMEQKVATTKAAFARKRRFNQDNRALKEYVLDAPVSRKHHQRTGRGRF